MNPFTHHPHSIDHTYWQHLCRALHIGACMIGAGVACVIHALLPWLFVNTASNTLDHLDQFRKPK